ncbi:MAG: helix-turn-helix transcriptional regulator [Bacteroidota bacterium]
MNKKFILNRIKKLIEDKNLNNSEFAEKIGIPKSSVTHLLSERNNPSLDLIIKISEAFDGISTDYLIFGSNNTIKDNLESINDLNEVLSKEISEDNVKEPNKKIKSIILIYENNKFEQINKLNN